MGMPNMQGMMRQVQKMQQQMAKVQAELEHKTVEADAGGIAGLVQGSSSSFTTNFMGMKSSGFGSRITTATKSSTGAPLPPET